MRPLAQTNEYDPMFEDDDFESIMTAIQNDEHKTLPSNTDDAGGRTGTQETGANSDDDAGGTRESPPWQDTGTPSVSHPNPTLLGNDDSSAKIVAPVTTKTAVIRAKSSPPKIEIIEIPDG